MFKIEQKVWIINNNRAEEMIVVGYEIKKLLYAFSESIGCDDDYVYLSTQREFEKSKVENKSEVHFALDCIKVMSNKVFLTKEDLIKSL